MDKVDLVITYLNSSDEKWQEEFKHYKELELNNNVHKVSDRQSFGAERTREWDNLRYWFRGVEQNLPWINKIFLVVQNENHVPEWLDKNNPKLRIVYHDEFIPKELLPTFNALPICFYMSNIKDLSEHFIYSDDDFFFINPMKQEEFFMGNEPVLDIRKEKYSIKDNVNEWETILNNNKYFYTNYIEGEKYILKTSHLPEPRIKSFEQGVIRENYDKFLNSFKISKFRHKNNYMSWLLIDMLKLNKPETDIERIRESKYIHFNSKVNLFNYKDCQMICVNDTEAMDNFTICRHNLLSFLNYKFPNKSSFEVDEGYDKVKPCFGIISWFPDDENHRKQRIERLNKTFEQIKNIFGEVEYLIVAQNWKEYELPDYVNAQVFKYDKLGILGARKTLGRHFLESKYDYLIMCDDDIILKTEDNFTKEYFFKELDAHPDGFMFLQYSWSLNLCAISKYIYAQTPMVDIDPEKGEGYEDTTYPWLLHYKHPNNEFKIYGIKFLQNNREFHQNHKSTWENKNVDHNRLNNLSKFYIGQFKKGNFKIDKKLANEFINELKWFDKAKWWGWTTPEEYEKFKRKYGID